MKIYYGPTVRMMFTALILILFTQPANSALVTGFSPSGNLVIPVTTNPGYTELSVTFFNLKSVQIDFNNTEIDSSLLLTQLPEDNIYINIYNSTGIGWSGFEFRFISASIASPIGVSPQSGEITAIDFSGYDPITGLASTSRLSFDPMETTGLLNGQGIVDTSVSSTYSLIIAPTAVPVPAAVWLLGSGLLGLIATGRCKKIHKTKQL